MLLWLLLAVRSPSDREFLEWVFHKYKNVIWARVCRVIDRAQDREDAVQEVMVHIVKNVKRIREIDNCELSGYIVILARNVALNYRDHLRVLHRRFIYRDDMSQCSEMSLTPEEIVIIHERLGMLHSVWPRLKEREQRLLEEKFILGYSDWEIARHIGCKPDSVRTLVRRATKHACRELIEKGECYE